MSKLKLFLAIAALAWLVVVGVTLNGVGTAASIPTQPHDGMHATIVPAANAAEKQVVLRGLGMT